MVLSNLSIPLLGIVDTAVMGHLPSAEYVGAIAIGGLIFNFMFWGLGFLRMGTTGITAQALGADDHLEVRASLARATLVAIVIAALILILKNPIASVSFALIDASPKVENLASSYYSTRIWSTPASLVNLVIVGWFVGMQNTKIPLILLLVSNGCNVLLDLLLVLVFKMDVDGVALATLIAEYLGLLVGLVWACRTLSQHSVSLCWTSVIDTSKMKHMLTINRQIFLRTLCLILVFAFFTAQSAKQGDVVLAANTILFNFYTLMAYGLDGFAYAAEALVGKAIGSRDRDALRRSVRVCAQWSGATALLFTLIYAVFGGLLIRLMTDITVVANSAHSYSAWAIIAPLLSAPSFLLDGIFVGATLGRDMQNSMIFAAAMVFLPSWYLLKPIGNHGLWLAFMLFMIARGISMGWIYRRIEPQLTGADPQQAV